MDKIILSEQHIGLTSANDIGAICAPLFNNSGIDYFEYGKIYNDYSSILLCTHRDWLYNSLAEGYADCVASLQFPEIDTFNIQYQLSSTIEPETCKQAEQLFGIRHIFEIVYEYRNFVEVFEFGSFDANTAPIDYYFNHLPELNKFNLYFKEKAADIITQAEKERIFFRINKQKPHITDHCDTTQSSDDTLHNQLLPKRFYISSRKQNLYLTRQQFSCIKYLAQGRSAKEIGNRLNVSNRTIEGYLEQLKTKIDAYNKSQLIDFYYATPELHIWSQTNTKRGH